MSEWTREDADDSKSRDYRRRDSSGGAGAGDDATKFYTIVKAGVYELCSHNNLELQQVVLPTPSLSSCGHVPTGRLPEQLIFGQKRAYWIVGRLKVEGYWSCVAKLADDARRSEDGPTTLITEGVDRIIKPHQQDT